MSENIFMSNDFCKRCKNNDVRVVKDMLNKYMLLMKDVAETLLDMEVSVTEAYDIVNRHIKEHKKKEIIKKWQKRLNIDGKHNLKYK